MVRLGVATDQPLAVQQWQGLIAINYPARAYGLNRHVTITEAQKACPQLIMQHVATWKEGDDKWAYHKDAFKHIGTHKVSLDPYRLQSRRILALIRQSLPNPPVQKVEKASVDEVFLDLSTQVHDVLLERFPELRGPPPYDDPSENLPPPPTSALDWNADALIDLDPEETEEDAPDWDDVAMLVGSEVVRSVRATIRERLQYTCSAGLARNKMLAKLGSAHKKPNSQTIVRNRAIQRFLGDLKFTKIRNLGGKMGDEVVSTFNTDSVKELLEVPHEQLKKNLGDDTGTWLYQVIRGEDYSEVNPRTQIKSMLSAKSFRPSINTFEQAVMWLRIFVADIFSRLVEEGVLENKRKPKTINLHHRQGAQTRSKQAPIPQGKTVDESVLFELAKNLLAQVIVDGRAWPCANLSLSVGGFEDGVTGNRDIGGFLVKGDEAKQVQEAMRHENETSAFLDAPPQKKRRVDEQRINKFFTKHDRKDEPVEFDEVPSGQRQANAPSDEPEDVYLDGEPTSNTTQRLVTGKSSSPLAEGHASSDAEAQGNERHELEPGNDQSPAKESIQCDRCQRGLKPEQREEHDDWHFARDIQSRENSRQSANPQPMAVSRPPSKVGRGRGRPPNRVASGGIERGQRRLAFGR